MKKYISPEMAIYKVNVQSVLETTSLALDENEVTGDKALGKRRRNTYNDWEDEDMWDEENQDQTLF